MLLFTASDLASITSHIHSWVLFLLWLHPFILTVERKKERYRHLNAEFQRIARIDKKTFLSDKCKEIEGKNRIGKTREVFKKIRDTKGIFKARWAQ